MTPEEWYDRAVAESRAGQPCMFFEIHDCGGVALPLPAKHPGIRICECEGIAPSYQSGRELIERHGLGDVGRWILAADPATGAGRYDRR